ncbi:uncharacterized protein G2W53_017723 [Senna tora]|uniref:Uncharacterized protein n=1 Tax=Senna tora TaxID=362788 RepID=A0A834TZ17_9FABA|nr:uncharacterized protein G2W53_017723 [Senna tora]
MGKEEPWYLSFMQLIVSRKPAQPP